VPPLPKAKQQAPSVPTRLSAKEVMFLLCLFVYLLAGLRKNCSTDFH